MTGEMATDSTQELITAVETSSRDGTSFPLFLIYISMAHYMRWFQYLDTLIDICKNQKFTYTKTEQNNSLLSVAQLQHFDNITKGHTRASV